MQTQIQIGCTLNLPPSTWRCRNRVMSDIWLGRQELKVPLGSCTLLPQGAIDCSKSAAEPIRSSRRGRSWLTPPDDVRKKALCVVSGDDAEKSDTIWTGSSIIT